MELTFCPRSVMGRTRGAVGRAFAVLSLQSFAADKLGGLGKALRGGRTAWNSWDFRVDGRLSGLEVQELLRDEGSLGGTLGDPSSSL